MIRKLLTFSLITAGIFCIVSCQKALNTDNLPASVTGTKILHTKAGSSPESIIVKFSEVPSNEELEAFSIEDIISFEKVFTSVPGKEELEKEFGLDRWYIAQLKDGADVEAAAKKLAGVTEINVVEYDIRM